MPQPMQQLSVILATVLQGARLGRERLQPWLLAARPRTLTIALAPVVAGSALSWRRHEMVDTGALAAALLAAVLIQVATNLHNDAQDVADDALGLRLGPARAAASGLLSPALLRRAAITLLLLAMLPGLYLVWRGGLPILALGLASMAAARAYSLRPSDSAPAFLRRLLPISHTPLGELFVIAFFGLGGVMGTFWLHARQLEITAALAGLVVGLPAAAVLLVNNTRDAAQDGLAGRRTLAILLGRRRALWLYAALLLLPYVLLLAPGFVGGAGRLPWPALLTLPFALWLARGFATWPLVRFNELLTLTARLQFAISALLALALVQ